ncbi:hypothetical protein [Ammoniphilus sp. 3BR4]|uniref:hypothetical protein n=1 Tax=Ammoniphilus sp. 3BR4 TaxID=3158265 RepID=UPI003466C9B9
MILRLYRSIAKNLQTFHSTKEMDEHLQLHVYKSGKRLHKNAKAVLGLLSRYSVAVSGVSWIKPINISLELNICLRTVLRALERIESLGIGHREEVEYNGMIFHYFILHKFDLLRVSEDVVNEVSKSQSEPSLDTASVECQIEDMKHLESTETNDQVPSKDVSKPDVLDSSFVPSNVPEEFISACKPFFNNANTIYSLWGKVLLAHRTNRLSTPVQSYIDTVIRSFRQSIFLLKSGKLRKDLGAYFYGTLERVFAVEKRREVPMYNWLEA